MAAIAAVSLTITVLIARRAVSNASQTIIRGEGQTLTLELQADLSLMDLRLAPGDAERAEDAGAQDVRDELDASLASLLEARAAEGLRYIAIVRPDGEPVASAGVARVAGRKAVDGDLAIDGDLARLATRMPPPKGSGGPPVRPPLGSVLRVEGPPPFDLGPRPDFGGPPPFGPGGRGGPPTGPFLVLEFEPPTIAELRRDGTLTLVVAVLAGLALVGFALGWSRTMLRVARIEQQAEGERRLVALGRMSSVMAHELRNPLASLKGHAQLLAEQIVDEPVSDKVKAKIDRVISEAERLELLTNSLLEFVRDRPLERAAVPARSLVDEALLDLPHERVHVDIARAGAPLLVDRARAARALHNLLHNAIEESPAGAPVELRVETAGADLTIEVRDHGRGLTAGSEQQIFEPFVTTRVRGTGLGLPIARRIAEQHGGTLVGATHPDGGAVFRMHLPGAAPPG